jgi:hypothetical protein
MAIVPEARVLRGKESWNFLYVALGFVGSIEGTVIGMMGLNFPNNVMLYALAGGITAYLFMFNGQVYPPHVVIRTRRPVDRRSRIQRWDDATNALLGIQAECVNWLEALPDSLRSTAMAEALEAITDIDLSALTEVKPPRGYGRD